MGKIIQFKRYFAAIRPSDVISQKVVWGIGQTKQACIADALEWTDKPCEVVEITEDQFLSIEDGEVCCNELGIT